MQLLNDDGKLLLVALDHIPLGIMAGWEQPEQTLQLMVEAQPDYLILNFGIIKRFNSLLKGKIKSILRLDGSPSYLVEDWTRASEWHLLFSVEDALRLDASAVIVNLLVGGNVEMSTLRILSKVSSSCLAHSVPLIVSVIPANDQSHNTPDEVAVFGARLASEFGADVVNSYIDSDLAVLSRIVSETPVPILLSGGKHRSDKETIARAANGVELGCAGICFGRSVWQSSQPLKVIQALKSVLKQGLPLEAALVHLNA